MASRSSAWRWLMLAWHPARLALSRCTAQGRHWATPSRRASLADQTYARAILHGICSKIHHAGPSDDCPGDAPGEFTNRKERFDSQLSAISHGVEHVSQANTGQK